MSTTRTRTAEATTRPIDPARASYVSGEYSEAKGMTRWTLRYAGTDETHTVTGWSDATECSCTCDGYRFSRKRTAQCRHTLGFGLLLEAVERERQEAKTTRELQFDEAWFSRQDSYTPDQRRALNCIRQILRARGVRSLASVAKGRAAVDELWNEEA